MKGLGNAKMFSKPFFKLYNKMKINDLRRLLHKAYCLLPIAYCLLLIATTPSVLTAQGTVYGIKGGLAVGNQSFNNGGTTSNGLLFKLYGDLLIESAPADNSGVMYMQVGYHPRGHAKRFQNGVYINSQGQQQAFEGFTQEFIFHNAGLTLGFKKRNVLNNPKAYYTLGLRGEYTIKDNLATASSGGGVYSLYNPTSEFVNKFVYGLSLGGGYEFAFSELTGGFVEFSVHPDIGRQYFQPAIQVNFRDPFSGQTITSIPEQSIRNLSFEITVGFRFLRKIEYID
jgi:hypothetical protein